MSAKRRAVALFAFALVLASCGGQPGSAATTTAQPTAQPTGTTEPSEPVATIAALPEPEVKDLRLGILAVGALTPVWLAEKSGYFADEGFNSVEVVTSYSSPDLLAQLPAGNLEFAHSNYMAAMQAVEAGVDIVNVEVSDHSSDGTEVDGRRDAYGMVTLSDSGITRPKDLEGRTMGVSAVPSLNWAFAWAAIEKDGGDPEKVEFLTVGFGDALAAVLTKQVDAAMFIEPFMTAAIAEGAVPFSFPYAEVFPEGGLSLGGLHTTRQFAEANPITVAKVVNAIQRAMDDMARDEELARSSVIEFAKLDPALASEIWIPPLHTLANVDTVRALSELGRERGMLKSPIDTDSYLWPTVLDFCPRDVCYYPSADYEHLDEGVTYR